MAMSRLLSAFGLGRKKTGLPAPKAATRHLRLEWLEGRLAPANYEVNTLAAGGPGSFDKAINDLKTSTDDSNTITFKDGLSGTIPIQATESILKNVVISGPGATTLGLHRGMVFSQFSLLSVSVGVTATITGLEIAGGSSTTVGGAGITNNGTLTLTNVTLDNNTAGARSGGAIWNIGNLTISGCSLYSNSAWQGGAIFNGGNLSISNSTITENTAGGMGGALYITSASTGTTLNNCSVSSNSSDWDGGAIYVDSGATFSMTGGSLVSRVVAQLS